MVIDAKRRAAQRRECLHRQREVAVTTTTTTTTTATITGTTTTTTVTEIVFLPPSHYLNDHEFPDT